MSEIKTVENRNLKIVRVISAMDFETVEERYLVDDRKSLKAFLKAFPEMEETAKKMKFRTNVMLGAEYIFRDPDHAKGVHPFGKISYRTCAFHPLNWYLENEDERK